MGVLIRRFLRCESGAAVYEFTLIAALVSAAILASVIALGVKIDSAHEALTVKAASPV